MALEAPKGPTSQTPLVFVSFSTASGELGHPWPANTLTNALEVLRKPMLLEDNKKCRLGIVGRGGNTTYIKHGIASLLLRGAQEETKEANLATTKHLFILFWVFECQFGGHEGPT